MTREAMNAQERADAIHDEEERQKALADGMPDGEEKDAHVMLGERLSDEACSIEEDNDLDARPSGLWGKDR